MELNSEGPTSTTFKPDFTSSTVISTAAPITEIERLKAEIVLLKELNQQQAQEIGRLKEQASANASSERAAVAAAKAIGEQIGQVYSTHVNGLNARLSNIHNNMPSVAAVEPQSATQQQQPVANNNDPSDNGSSELVMIAAFQENKDTATEITKHAVTTNAQICSTHVSGINVRSTTTNNQAPVANNNSSAIESSERVTIAAFQANKDTATINTEHATTNAATNTKHAVTSNVQILTAHINGLIARSSNNNES